MKRIERHKLKENDFAETVARARDLLVERQQTVTVTVVAIVAVVVILGAFMAWRTSRKNHATESLAQALAVAEAPVVTPPPPAPGSPPPVQQPGTFRTEQARAEAALPMLMKTADSYPSTDAGVTARFRAAATLADLGRFPEAEQRYREVIDKAGRSSIYAKTAKLGLADTLAAEKKYDEAISTLKELTTDSNLQLPLDGVLMQLARTAAQGGKTDEATRAYNRIINEFPQSLYAAEAKQKVAELRG
jgi:TolA-binding protein